MMHYLYSPLHRVASRPRPSADRFAAAAAWQTRESLLQRRAAQLRRVPDAPPGATR